MTELVHKESPKDLVSQERERAAARARRTAKTTRLFSGLGILLPFVVVLLFSIIQVPNFLTANNITNVLVNASILAITGFGMTIVIALRGIDLSVGSIQALVACVTAITMNAFGILPGILAGIATAVALGAVNGVVVTYLRVPGFVATLSTMSVFRGLVLLITGGAAILVSNKSFNGFAIGSVFGIPIPLIVALVVGAVLWVCMDRTRFGKHVVALGGNPEAARDSGVNVKRVELTAYIIGGLCAGIAGILLTSQLGIVNGSLSTGLELQVIAIVVLGGTSLLGGRAHLVGTFIAALLLATINSALNLLNTSSFYQYIALGVLLIFALSMDRIQVLAARRALKGASNGK